MGQTFSKTPFGSEKRVGNVLFLSFEVVIPGLREDY